MTRTAGARTTKQQQLDHRAAQLRAQLDRQRRRRRQVLVAIVASVVAVVAVVVVVGLSSSGSSNSSGTGRNTPPAGVLANLSNVPAATLNGIGAGDSTNPPRGVSDASLTQGGLPLVLYIGSEYCPYCAVERWPLIQALSRFGTFKGLTTTRSAAKDVFPSTPTFTFYGATYTSSYLAFEARELYTNEIKNNKYVPLQKLTASEQAIFNRYGAGTPLLDFAGKYVLAGASYPPGVLHGLTWTQIAGSLSDPRSQVARGVDGAANVLTATLCRLTGGQPATVCTAPGVKAADQKL